MPNNLEWIAASVVRQLKFSQGDFQYIRRMNSWIHEQFESNPALLELFIQNGLLEEMLEGIFNIHNSTTSNEFLTEFFVMIKSIICMLDINIPIEVSEKLVELMLQESLIFDSSINELTLSCLVLLIRYQGVKSYYKYLDMLEFSKKDFQVMKRLLEAVQDILKDSGTKKNCQENFVKAGIMKMLREILEGSYVQQFTGAVWVSTLECIRFLIQENEYCKQRLQEINFKHLSSVLVSDSFRRKKAEVCENCIEILLYILFESTNLSVVHEVVTPQVIPLVITMLCNTGSEFYKYILECMDSEYNSAHFSFNHTIENLLEQFPLIESEKVLSFMKKMIEKVVSQNISPLEMRSIITHCCKTYHEKQMLLFKAINQGFSASFQRNTNKNPKIPIYKTNETDYFWFRGQTNYIHLFSEGFEFLPNKDFTIMIWACPLSQDKGCLLDFTDGRSQFTIFANKNSIEATFINEKKLIFKLVTMPLLYENQWNLICICFQQTTKLLSSINSLEIFINNRMCEKNIEGKITHISPSFPSLYIGNTSELKCNFQGKISLCVICNKYFSEFDSIYALHDDFYLPFIPEATSIFQKFDTKFSKELNKFKHFEYFSHFPDLKTDGLTVKNCSVTFNGVSIVNSLISLGGLLCFLPILKEAYIDQDLVLEILTTIKIFTRATSLDSLISKDFFEVLSTVIEPNCCPSRELLNLVTEMLENLEWSPEYQRKVFFSLVLNSRLWKQIPADIHEDYLEVLVEYSPKHIECRLEPCATLYAHLMSLGPVPIPVLVGIFSKLLPKGLMNGENLNAVAYLLLKMVYDKVELVGLFLEELSLVKIEKKCCLDMIYFILHFLEWIHNYAVQAGLFRVLKNLMLSMISATKEKDLGAVEEILWFVLQDIDNKLEKEVSLEVFQAIIDIVITSFSFSSKRLADLFGMFIDLITKRIVNLGEHIKVEVLKATSDYQFCALLSERENFPEWLTALFEQDVNSASTIGIQLFTESALKVNLHKLRLFLISISPVDFNASILFYSKILRSLASQNSFAMPHLFLDFASILEDLLNSDITGRSVLDMELYTDILESLVSQSVNHELTHCTYPPLPHMDFSVQYDLLRQKQPEMPINEENVYLREGGFLRLILKYIFIGLNTTSSSRLLNLLKSVLNPQMFADTSGNVLQLNQSQKQAIDKLLVDCNTERYSISYPKFPNRDGDLLYTEKFLSFYILIELTEILTRVPDQELLDFTLLFLQKSNIDGWLVSWSKKITNKELEDFYKMMKDQKFLFYATARTRLPQMERNEYLQMMTQITPVSLQVFQINIAEQAENLTRAKNSEELLRNLLVSPNWLSRVHLFLLGYTSMKINFIGNIVCTHYFDCKPSIAAVFTASHGEDFCGKLSTFMICKQEELKLRYSSFVTTEGKLKLVLQQRFADMCQVYSRIDTMFYKGKIKLRWSLDRLGRIGTFTKMKNKDRASFRKSKTIPLPTETVFKASFLVTLSTDNSVTESVDESEIGTVIMEPGEDLAENTLPDVQKLVRAECERIKISCSVFGEIEVCQDYVLFTSDRSEKPSEPKFFGSALKFTEEPKKSTKFIEISEISEVFPRRFIHRHTAFEIYLKSGLSYLFNVFTPESRDSIFSVIKRWPQVKLCQDPSGSQLRAFTNKWKKNLISNLEYLLILNKFASRSFNDISQYPVFPWVLKDYHSVELKIDDPHVYRNFKLPVGAQNELARQEADRRFSMWIDEQPYHFGSHYSCGAVVLHYLVRIEPFSTQAKLLQGGKFDIADRLFHSLEASWESGQGSNGDVKELVPELFYLPEVLSNINNEEFGAKQDEEEVFHVELPRWANSAFDFTRKHRQALESNYVSSQLNHWIDLIFGNKQKGKLAQNAYNLYCPMTYEENFAKIMGSGETEAYLQGMVDQVVHFGQTPVRLFKKPHPSCESKAVDQNIFDKYRKHSELLSNGCETNGEICALLITESFLILVKNVNERMSMIRISLNELDGNRVVFERRKEKVLQGSRPSRPSSEEYYCMWGESHLVSGSQVDKSFKIHSLAGVLEASVYSHTDMVSSVCAIGSVLVTGGRDATLYSWVEGKNSDKHFRILKHRQYLGHTSKVVQIRGLEIHEILVSLGENRTIFMHDLRSAECFRAIESGAVAIRVSSMGLVAAITEDEVQVFTVNESHVCTKKIQINKCLFDSSGENLYYCFGNTWGFFNLFDDHKKFKQDEELPISHLQLPYGCEYFIHSQAGEKTNFVLTFQLISKESLRVIRRHNILQD